MPETASTASNVLRLSSPITLSATGDKKKRPKFRAVAYTGATMTIAGYGRVIIDLAGLNLPASVPILLDHDNSVGSIAGSGRPRIENGELVIVGNIATTPAGQQVLSLLSDGMALAASVGVEPTATKYIRQGETIAVNGKNVEATEDLVLVTEGRLREVSIVPVGADPSTEVSLAARAAEGVTMPAQQTATPTQTTDPEAIRAEERTRTREILATCQPYADNPHIADLQARALDGQITLDVLRAGVLDALRAARPVPATSVRGRAMPADVSVERILTAAWLARMGRESLAEKEPDIGPRAVEAAASLRTRHVMDLLECGLRLAGAQVPDSENRMIRAAFSTQAMTTALGNAANKVALDQYRETRATWRAFSRIVDLRDFKTAPLVRPIFGGGFDLVGEAGDLKHGTLTEETSSISADTSGKLLILTRKALVNDDLGVFAGCGQALGRDAARYVADIVFGALLDNKTPEGNDFFSEANGNLLEGAENALSHASLAGAIAAMLSRVDSEGRSIDLAPKTLVVPPALDVAAHEIINSTLIARDTANSGDRLPQGNALYQRLAIEVEPRLANSEFHDAATDTQWMLFASPADGAVTVGFLNGLDSPIIEQVELPPDQLGVGFRGYIDCGVSLTDPRAATKSTGAGAGA